LTIKSLREQYLDKGFISAIDIVSSETARQHRIALETVKSQIGSLHYISKVHTILQSPFELATNPALLNVVEACIGHYLLLYNVTYIIKEPHSKSHVSWHQDLTYWGFDSDDQISVWLALSPATEQSDCMKMIPCSHRDGRVEH
jgi:ectoine hydroxylase-related dioxygenase (phytanoyl-CoA dioxygenase family)